MAENKEKWTEGEDKLLTRCHCACAARLKLFKSCSAGHEPDRLCLHAWWHWHTDGAASNAAGACSLVGDLEPKDKKEWSILLPSFPGRIGKQLRERWENHLRPGINFGPWTEPEELAFVRAHMQLGNRWAQIARLLPGRTENGVKNHWHATLRKTLRNEGSAAQVQPPCSCQRGPAHAVLLHSQLSSPAAILSHLSQHVLVNRAGALQRCCMSTSARQGHASAPRHRCTRDDRPAASRAPQAAPLTASKLRLAARPSAQPHTGAHCTGPSAELLQSSSARISTRAARPVAVMMPGVTAPGALVRYTTCTACCMPGQNLMHEAAQQPQPSLTSHARTISAVNFVACQWQPVHDLSQYMSTAPRAMQDSSHASCLAQLVAPMGSRPAEHEQVHEQTLGFSVCMLAGSVSAPPRQGPTHSVASMLPSGQRQ